MQSSVVACRVAWPTPSSLTDALEQLWRQRNIPLTASHLIQKSAVKILNGTMKLDHNGISLESCRF